MRLFRNLFLDAILFVAILVLPGCASTGGKGLDFLRPTDINEKVYVLPHKPLVKKHIDPGQALPRPVTDANLPAVPYVIKDHRPSAQLVKPPKIYEVPADTAPVNELGEDEEVKARRLEKNPNNAPSKESIWNLFSGRKAN